MARERLVVIGNGMVGLRFLEELRSSAPERYDVTVVGSEPNPAYNRVLLSSLLACEVDENGCRFRDRQWYLRNGIRLIAGMPATEIDVAEREVVVGSDTVLPFDRLVLATGSDAIRLPIPGADLPGVLSFRTLGDVAAIRAASLPGARAVVIGGGLLGLEAAYGLARAGVATTVVHLMDRVMERQLDPRAAAMVRAAMEAKGITFALEAHTAGIEGDACVTGVRLADGRILPADLVVMAVGVRPAVQLASHSGLSVERGVMIDDGLQTSVPNIYAIGECAEHRGAVYGLVEPGYQQARILAQRLAGHDISYEGTTLSTNLKVSGLPVFSAGEIGEDGEVIRLSDPGAGVYKKLLVREGRLVGAVLVGDTADGLWYLDLIRTGSSIKSFRADLIFGPALAAPDQALLRAAV